MIPRVEKLIKKYLLTIVFLLEWMSVLYESTFSCGVLSFKMLVFLYQCVCKSVMTCGLLSHKNVALYKHIFCINLCHSLFPY